MQEVVSYGSSRADLLTDSLDISMCIFHLEENRNCDIIVEANSDISFILVEQNIWETAMRLTKTGKLKSSIMIICWLNLIIDNHI